MIEKRHQQLKQISILHVVIHYLRIVHLIAIKIKHDYYRGKDCMKNFYKDLREHVMKTKQPISKY